MPATAKSNDGLVTPDGVLALLQHAVFVPLVRVVAAAELSHLYHRHRQDCAGQRACDFGPAEPEVIGLGLGLELGLTPTSDLNISIL